MAEPESDFLKRIEERIARATEDIRAMRTHPYDPNANLQRAIDTHTKSISALLEIIGMLAAEVERLRHQLEHPSR